jgi:hypothetical protein
MLCVTIDVEKSFTDLQDTECTFKMTSMGFVRGNEKICQQQRPTNLMMKYVSDTMKNGFMIVPPSPIWSFIGMHITEDLKVLELKRHNLELAGMTFLIETNTAELSTHNEIYVVLEMKDNAVCLCNTIEVLTELQLPTSKLTQLKDKGRDTLMRYLNDTYEFNNVDNVIEFQMSEIRPQLIGTSLFMSLHRMKEKEQPAKKPKGNRKLNKTEKEAAITTDDTGNLIPTINDTIIDSSLKRKSDAIERKINKKKKRKKNDSITSEEMSEFIQNESKKNVRDSSAALIFGYEKGNFVLSRQGIKDENDDLVLPNTKGTIVNIISSRRKEKSYTVLWDDGKKGEDYKEKQSGSNSYDIFCPVTCDNNL